MVAKLGGTPLLDGNPNQWADHSKNRIWFDYDVYAEMGKWWMGDGREKIEALTSERGRNTSKDSNQDDSEEVFPFFSIDF